MCFSKRVPEHYFWFNAKCSLDFEGRTEVERATKPTPKSKWTTNSRFAFIYWNVYFWPKPSTSKCTHHTYMRRFVCILSTLRHEHTGHTDKHTSVEWTRCSKCATVLFSFLLISYWSLTSGGAIHPKRKRPKSPRTCMYVCLSGWCLGWMHISNMECDQWMQ